MMEILNVMLLGYI